MTFPMNNTRAPRAASSRITATRFIRESRARKQPRTLVAGELPGYSPGATSNKFIAVPTLKPQELTVGKSAVMQLLGPELGNDQSPLVRNPAHSSRELGLLFTQPGGVLS